VSICVAVAGKEELSIPGKRDLILERFQRELRQRDLGDSIRRLGIGDPKDSIEKIDLVLFHRK
jgi:hypothetical protein